MDQFWSEGAAFGDFNRDDKPDFVAGPWWWEGPALKKRHEIYPATKTFTVKKPDGTEATIHGFEGGLGVKNTYSDNFFAFPHDFNRDGWMDLLVIGFPGKDSSWFENPRGKDQHWTRHLAIDVTDNESPAFGDITGDGKPEILCGKGGRYGWVEPDAEDPTKPWRFHPISAQDKRIQRFTHGLGFGDVDGDGRKDLIDATGWWQQPASLEGDPEWAHNPAALGPSGAQMYAYDVNGDGRSDIVSSLEAHGYGLAWFENRRVDGNITFDRHVIMNKESSDNRYGVKFAQPHGVALVDIDGDGLMDIVTGKRFWAHGQKGDVESDAPAVIYWFRLVRGSDHVVDFVPYLIDDHSGIGTGVFVADFNKDKRPDLAIANKKGAFVFIHQARKVGKTVWQKAQPKPVP
jgi:hypothetical protein